MPRANRYYVPGYTWHLTHRCHKKEFLLKFDRDRARYLWWLFEAKKRFHLCILNYVVTSNHVHILVVDTGDNAIPKSMQLIAGRTGQEYNARKDRKGTYWEDRYHATAVQTNEHLVRCMLYIDFNMVRAGVVGHPSFWPYGGYQEIVAPPKRYARVDHGMLIDLLGMHGLDELSAWYRACVDEELRRAGHRRAPGWTESLAVGDKGYVDEVKQNLLSRAVVRKTHEREEGVFELREPVVSYNPVFDPQNSLLSLKNSVKWGVNQ
jgi:REP element-mobilizing transposase RayT